MESKPPDPHGMQIGLQPVSVPPPDSEQDETPHVQYPGSEEAVRLRAFSDPRMEAVAEKREDIIFLADFITWVTQADFLRFQAPEPMVGDTPGNYHYPVAVNTLGISGQSVYTALFHHLDMETFTCRLCAHIVKDELEDAITHQRIAHFRHYPYRCLTTQTQWYVCLFFKGP